MGRTRDIVRDELRAAVAAEVAKGNTNVSRIARALSIDRRTVRAHLAALEEPQVVVASQATSDTEARAAAARTVLWDLLNDPAAAPQARIAAHAALAEAEGWNVQATELPEPRTEAELTARTVTLLRSLPPVVLRAAS